MEIGDWRWRWTTSRVYSFYDVYLAEAASSAGFWPGSRFPSHSLDGKDTLASAASLILLLFLTFFEALFAL